MILQVPSAKGPCIPGGKAVPQHLETHSLHITFSTGSASSCPLAGRCFRCSCSNLILPSIAASSSPLGIAPFVSPSAIMSRVSTQINVVMICLERNSRNHNK